MHGRRLGLHDSAPLPVPLAEKALRFQLLLVSFEGVLSISLLLLRSRNVLTLK